MRHAACGMRQATPVSPPPGVTTTHVPFSRHFVAAAQRAVSVVESVVESVVNAKHCAP
jgi:hypothetical protein